MTGMSHKGILKKWRVCLIKRKLLNKSLCCGSNYHFQVITTILHDIHVYMYVGKTWWGVLINQAILIQQYPFREALLHILGTTQLTEGLWKLHTSTSSNCFPQRTAPLYCWRPCFLQNTQREKLISLKPFNSVMVTLVRVSWWSMATILQSFVNVHKVHTRKYK